MEATGTLLGFLIALASILFAWGVAKGQQMREERDDDHTPRWDGIRD